MKTHKQRILEEYYKEVQARNADNLYNHPDAHLLFDIVTKYIVANNWKYNGRSKQAQESLLNTFPGTEITVNCFHLSKFILDLAKSIGFKSEECCTIEIKNFLAKKSAYTAGIQESFDKNNLTRDSNGDYAFDIHCIALIDNHYFDVTLQSKYPLINDGIDIYHALSNAMFDSDIEEFLSCLPYLLDINETRDHWTLLHYAFSSEKYNFARALIERGASDNIRDNLGCAPVNILNDNLMNAQYKHDIKKINEIIPCLYAKIRTIEKNCDTMPSKILLPTFDAYKAKNSLLSEKKKKKHTP